MPDTTILSWITAEVDQALERVRSELAAGLLAACPEHLHQVSGALNMVGLSGATRFCEALEKSFGGPELSGEQAAVVDRAVVQLKQYVDEVASGQPDAAVRLYPAYRELAELQGREDSSEIELFFPNLTPPAPSHSSPKSLDNGELASFLQALRTRWQRGILGWLRKQPHALEEMRETLEELHSVAHLLPERRAFWWVAGGVVDALLDVTEANALAHARRLWTKIDIHIRELATGNQPDNEALLRELIYAVAGSPPLTQRIRDIKLLYHLDILLPISAPAQPDARTLEPVLAEVREKVRKLRKFWRQYMAGEPRARATFAERVRTLKDKAAPLQSAHFDLLLETLGQAAEHLPEVHPADSDAMLVEMAAAFLIADSILATFGKAPADLDEQLLDSYARGQGSEKIVQALAPQLRQIRGALSVLRWDRAVEVIECCQAMLASLARGSADMDWLAEGLSSIGLFITPCLEGREPRESAIETFLGRFAKRAAPAPAAEAKAALAAQSNELLPIFLEEAVEVLKAIDDALAVCKAQPDDPEALISIRRGFHTLKGSGRMVGLTQLAEVAWEVEQALNRWLEEKRPATPE